jgi:two-component system sensor histidine kinase PhoQ
VAAVRDGDRVVLAVEDDGPGIDPDRGRELLQRGVRADESVPGHGIGLAVVRDIASAYGGDVTIGRSPLGGARVALRLRA